MRPSRNAVSELESAASKRELECFKISSVTREGVDRLLGRVMGLLRDEQLEGFEE